MPRKHEDGEELLCKDRLRSRDTQAIARNYKCTIELKELEKQREAAATKLQSVQRARMSRRIVIARLKELKSQSRRGS